MIKVIVASSPIKPLIMKFDGMPMIYKRRDGYTDPATIEEILLMSTQGYVPKYDSGKTDIPFQMDDFKK